MNNLPPGTCDRDVSDAAERRYATGRLMTFGEWAAEHPGPAEDFVAGFGAAVTELIAECHGMRSGALGITFEARWEEYWTEHAPETAYERES